MRKSELFEKEGGHIKAQYACRVVRLITITKIKKEDNTYSFKRIKDVN